jgi:hypothetical protein
LLSDTDAVEILIKIIKNSINLEKIAIVNASSTAQEADEYSSYIHNDKGPPSLYI